MLIDNLYAGLFTRMVNVGEKNPAGEACYDGYQRVLFAAVDGKNIESISFPTAKADYRDHLGKMIPIVCFAVMTSAGVVIGVEKIK